MGRLFGAGPEECKVACSPSEYLTRGTAKPPVE